MGDIHFVHDRAFKSVMADIRVAREFFEQYLPASVLALINLDSLKLSENDYVDEDLNEFRSDVLYEVKLKNDSMAYLYLLAEHKSAVDKLMPFTLLKYIVKTWHRHLQQTQDTSLPLIIPLVFYHGKKPYDGPRILSEIIQGPSDLVQEVLFHSFHLIDTNDIKDEELLERRWADILTFMFKHVYDRDAWISVQPLIERLKRIQGEAGVVSFTNTLLKYWLEAAEIRGKSPKKFIETVQQGLSTPIGGEVMTMAEQLRQEGEKRGIQKGIQQGEGRMLIRQLERKFNVVPEYYKRKIEQASPDSLLEWGDKILDSQKLEEVF